jgi:hypothetical protein
MVWQPDIWTGDVRRVLYKRLVKEFGPLDNWKKRTRRGEASKPQPSSPALGENIADTRRKARQWRAFAI